MTAFVNSRVIQVMPVPDGLDLRVARFDGTSHSGGQVFIHSVVALALVRYSVDGGDYVIEPVILDGLNRRIDVCNTHYDVTCNDAILSTDDRVTGIEWVKCIGDRSDEYIGSIQFDGDGLGVEIVVDVKGAP